MKKKIKEKHGDCEIEGYMDFSDEEKPKFKIKMKGKCPSNILNELN